MTIAPEQYLKYRRCAAGLSTADVAGRLVSAPAMSEHDRREYLELVEAGVQPIQFATIIALRRIYPFSINLLIALERIRQGFDEKPPRLCRICACSEYDPCAVPDPESTCGWAGADICTECAGDPADSAIEAEAA